MSYTFDDVIADPELGRMVILSLVTIPLCILTTILRLVATKNSRRKLGWDDLCAVLALVGFLVYAIAPLAGVAAAGDLDDQGVAIISAKLAYVVTPFFYINQLFARGSLLILYHRIFWSDRTFVKWIYILATIHICWFITFFFLVLFLCNPVSKWWDVVGDQPGYCLDGNAFLVSEETINSSLDFATIILTVAVVKKLQTRQFIKTKLIFTFLVGGLSGVVGFVKIGIVYQAVDTNGQENDTNAFWDILQMATAIFCACAPMFKALIPLRGSWIRLKSSVASWASKTQLHVSDYKIISPGNFRKRHRRGGDDGSSGSQGVAEWPMTEYTWSSGETDYTELPIQNPADAKMAQTKKGISIV